MWKKIFANIAGVALACAGVQQGTGMQLDSAGWHTFGLGILMCVIANQIGLHQHKPTST